MRAARLVGPGGMLEVGDGARHVVRTIEVHRELGGDFRRARAVRGLEAHADEPVDLGAARGGDAVCEHLTIERVQELEVRRDRAIGPLCGTQLAHEQILPRESAEHALDVVHRDLGTGGNRGGRAGGAAGARHHEQVALGRCEPIDLLFDGAPDVLGNAE